MKKNTLEKSISVINELLEQHSEDYSPQETHRYIMAFNYIVDYVNSTNKEMQGIVFELKGFNDYVLIELKGKPFNNSKLAKLLHYINNDRDD